jgi:hypothetical protein
LAAANCRAPFLATGPLLPLVMVDLNLSFTVAGLLSGHRRAWSERSRCGKPGAKPS